MSLLNEKKMEFLQSRHSYVTYFKIFQNKDIQMKKIFQRIQLLLLLSQVFPKFSHYFELPLHQLLITHTNQRHLNNLTYIIQASNYWKLI